MTTLFIYWQKLNRYFNQLSLRERLLAALVAVVLTYSLWDAVWLQALDKHHLALMAEAHSLRQEMGALGNSLAELRAQPQSDTRVVLTQRAAQLEQRIARLDQTVQQRLQTLISPAEMANLLQAWLQQQSSLTLVKLENLPPTAIFNADLSGDETWQLFKHGLHLEFRGSYLETLAYLHALEALPWSMYWERVSVTVQAYPETQVELTVYTLSFSTTWIGG